MTLTSVNDRISQAFEPGAPLPSRRLEALRQLVDAGLNTYAMVGPVLPILSDDDLKDLVSAISRTGTKRLMIDRMRYRPGMEERVAKIPLMETEPYHQRYQMGMADRDSAQALEQVLALACKERSLTFEHAFGQ